MTFLSLSALFSLAALAGAPMPAHLQTVAPVGLPQLSQSADWRVRQQAAAIAAWQSDPELAERAWGVQPLETRAGFLRFSDPALRDSGMAPVLVERLLTLGEPEGVRMALVDLLPRAGGDWSSALSAAYPTEDQPGVRMLMVETARRAAPDDARELVTLGASDSAQTVRAAAMRLAPRLDDSTLADLVLAGLSDTAPQVRADAARSAGWMALDGARQPLSGLLSDADSDVRLSALRALEKLDPAALRAHPQLSALQADADPRVARAAQSAAR